MDLHDTEYGSRDYAARDPEGHHWYFGTYAPDLAGHSSELWRLAGVVRCQQHSPGEPFYSHGLPEWSERGTKRRANRPII